MITYPQQKWPELHEGTINNKPWCAQRENTHLHAESIWLVFYSLLEPHMHLVFLVTRPEKMYTLYFVMKSYFSIQDLE